MLQLAREATPATGAAVTATWASSNLLEFVQRLGRAATKQLARVATLAAVGATTLAFGRKLARLLDQQLARASEAATQSPLWAATDMPSSVNK